MPHLQLTLLGAFQATLDGEPVVGFESNKVRALLAYLAVEANRPHPRTTLAGLLWPERPDCDALANLRYALSNLRQTIGDRAANPPFLLITHDTLQFNVLSDHRLDVAAFEALIGQGDPNALQAAVSSCQGDFLEGFALVDSAPFEEWLTLKREQVSRRMFRVLRSLADHCERQGEYEQARYYAQRQVEREPWQEEAHQQLMRMLALGGHRAAALAQFETCRRVLAAELDVAPARETVLLYEAIRDGKLIAPHLAALPAAHSGASGGEPARSLCVARERELGRLSGFLDKALAGAGRIAFVIGEAGSGKTVLLDEFARRSLAAHADLLAANGRCNATTGYGDPYLPFLEILHLLTGDTGRPAGCRDDPPGGRPAPLFSPAGHCAGLAGSRPRPDRPLRARGHLDGKTAGLRSRPGGAT